nr:hypothetical protein [Mycobacterium sp. E3298]
MAQYYAIAKNENGKAEIITHETFTDRITARVESEHIAKIKGFTDVVVHLMQGTKKGGSTNTKFNQRRKRNNNDMPHEYYGAL